ncbi:C6 finger domain protein [Cordyceps javanica]|nr:C6 finger domain protein [Cordyceps javanica]
MRQKRWTPRVRTGCNTCRARRVKCDEGRPVCKRCCIGGRTCEYQLRWQSPTDGTAALRQRELRPASVAPLRETEPPDWDYMQSIRYYLTVIKPMRSNELETVREPPFNSGQVIPASFTCLVLANRMANAAKSRSRLIRLEELAFSGLWTQYYRYLQKHLAVVNKLMQSDEKMDKSIAIFSLYALLCLDCSAGGTMWQAHLNGSLAYVQHIGGIKALQALPRGTARFRLILCRAIFFNTTSPANRQVLGYFSYSDEELWSVLCDQEISGDTPCPVILLMGIVQINRLRFQVATKATAKEDFNTGVLEVFDTIKSFDLHSWAKGRSFANEAITLSLGHVFLAAVRLYGILTLLQPKAISGFHVASYPSISTAGAHTPEELRVREAQELVKLLRQLWPAMKYIPALQWPLIVVGVGVAGGLTADQKFIDHCLYSIWHYPLNDSNIFRCLEKLRVIWGSGMTGWEDCFDEPIPC